MDGLYQSPPYLPQQPMYRTNNYIEHNNNNHHHHHHHHHHEDPWSSPPHHPMYNPMIPRPKITTNVWEDEGTLCFQVDAKGICVARRQDNDMINGTKLLNVVGMSRGKRDGILKNEKGRVVVKVGAMHLKGVWIPFNRATELAEKFKILDVLYPLFVDEPSIYLCNSMNASHNNDVIPSPPKCSPLPREEYNNWEPTRHYMMNSNHYDVLHRNGDQRPYEENNMYLLNNDYYHQRHLNRGSFSSVSSHLYEDENKIIDNYTRPVYSSPYIKSSPYTNIPKSTGSATPSSWLSPETPTAVLFQKKRKSSCDENDIRPTRKIRIEE